jgi:integrase
LLCRQKAWIEKRLGAKKPRPVPIDVQRMILTGEKGRALSVDAFRHVMIDSFNDVEGLETGLASGGVTTHGLRYAAATRLYELKQSLEVIASITGHETIAMVKKYAEKKRNAQLAIAALNVGTGAQKSNENDKLDLEK